ncbi:hypothetical protein [Prochlorococcus sp. MIT 1341]|uniref:hypothetical protein n=1 Tax=Prochlorococcus sp. MIT 1341 TaxID=3096221 RepID=UPI002A7528F7|nr:hypothetical protein [Prochlorococcus sp. MIT 1341]
MTSKVLFDTNTLVPLTDDAMGVNVIWFALQHHSQEWVSVATGCKKRDRSLYGAMQ